jgi:hypothetical protein
LVIVAGPVALACVEDNSVQICVANNGFLNFNQVSTLAGL